MRLTIHHDTVYRYASPAASVVQVLRMTPRGHSGQHIVEWRIDLDVDCRLRQSEDAFGNITHVFNAEGEIDEICVQVAGVVETFDTTGVVQGAVERLPEEVFLRDTPLTQHDPALRAFADEAAAGAEGALARLHRLMEAIHEAMRFDRDATTTATRATEAFALKRGVSQDFTHVFVAGARHLGIPARYVAGYSLGSTDGVGQAGHSWAEAYVERLGWIGFDAVENICPQGGHVRVATGLDYLGAAPLRGARLGGAAERLGVTVTMTGDPSQSWQSQS